MSRPTEITGSRKRDQTKRGDFNPGEAKSSRPFRIILAEDDLEMRRLMARAFEERNFEVVQCTDGNELVKQLGLLVSDETDGAVDLIITDIRMPGATGLEILESTKELVGAPPFILITAFPDQQIRDLAKTLNASALFEKPFEISGLVDKAEEIVARGWKGPFGEKSA